MLIDSCLFILIAFVRFFVFLCMMVAKHMVIADGVIAGLVTYVSLDYWTGLPVEVNILFAAFVCLGLILISKWRLSFIPIAILGSLLWAWIAFELISWDMRDHLVLSAMLIVFNFLLHLRSRGIIFGELDKV